MKLPEVERACRTVGLPGAEVKAPTDAALKRAGVVAVVWIPHVHSMPIIVLPDGTVAHREWKREAVTITSTGTLLVDRLREARHVLLKLRRELDFLLDLDEAAPTPRTRKPRATAGSAS